MNAYTVNALDAFGDLQTQLRTAGFGGPAAPAALGWKHARRPWKQHAGRCCWPRSGPAGGVIAAADLARAAGAAEVVTTDMGGTSFDVSVVTDGQTATAAAACCSACRRPSRGSMSNPFGAGGGSIAWADSRGVLRVGPECGGLRSGAGLRARRAKRPVPDAFVVLGYIDPTGFLGGARPLDRARRASRRAPGWVSRRWGWRPSRPGRSGEVALAGMARTVASLAGRHGLAREPRPSSATAGAGAVRPGI